jgi:hypothetical protein
MNLKLIHHPQMPPLDNQVNDGFDLSDIKALLLELEKLGVAWKAIGTDAMSDEELSDLYMEAVAPAVYKKYHVRKVFGSNRHSASFFGKEVPALLVYEPGKQYPSDIYPHQAGDHVVTIRAFLEDLLKKLEKAPMMVGRRETDKALAQRMDRLREKIGPIGVPVAQLIREGRRK